MLVAAATVVAAALVPVAPAAASTTESSAPPQARTQVANGNWTWQRPTPTGEPLYGISCPNIGVCYAVGALGTIEATTDFGQTWTVQGSGVSDIITAVSCIDANTCVAVDVQGHAVHTTNGGAAWSPASVGTVPLNAISCVSDLQHPIQCMAAGDGGVIYRSDDYGATWTSLSSGVSRNLYGLSCWAYAGCVTVGSAGIALSAVNDGASWQTLNSSVSVNLYAVTCPSGAMCAAVGQGGTIASEGNLAAPWIVTQLPTTHALLAVDCNDRCMVTTDDGLLYTGPTPDWQQRASSFPWSPATGLAAGALRAVSCTGATAARQFFLAYNCMAVGDFGTVVASRNHGNAWFPRNAVDLASYGAISCGSATSCVAVANETGAGNIHSNCPPSGQCVLTRPPGAIAHTSNGGLTWPLITSPVVDNILGTSCPTPSECIGVGVNGVGVKSTDGGVTWASNPTGQASSLYNISCPTATNCFAAGESGTIVSTSDAGATWTSLATGTTRTVDSISCPSTTTCVANLNAVGIGPQAGAVLRTTDGGATWSSTTLAGWWGMVDCPAVANCYLSSLNPTPSTVMFSSDAGATWTDSSPAAGSFLYLMSIECPAALVCYIMSFQSGYEETTDGGQHWAPIQTAGNPPLLGRLTCPTTTTCYTGGNNGTVAITNDGAVTWRLVAPYTGSPTLTDLHDVTCPTSTDCYAISSDTRSAAGFVITSADGGQDWYGIYTDQNNPPQAMSCPSQLTCFITITRSSVYGQVIATQDGGVTWTVKTNSGSALGLVECPSRMVCFVSESSGQWLKTVDGGANWSSISTMPNFSDLNCPSTTTCYGTVASADGETWRSADGGQTWNRVFSTATDPNAAVRSPLQAIHCFDPQTCYAVGNRGLIAATTDGINWHTDSTPTSTDLVDVTCASAGTCLAVGGHFALRTIDFGGTWDLQTAATTAESIKAVACATPLVCVTVGLSGLISRTAAGGVEWSKALPAQRTNPVGSLTCPDASNCYGAARDRAITSHDGGNTWTERALNNSDQANGVSCPSASVCFAVGWPGAIYRSTDSGTTWLAEQNPISGNDETLESISCPTTTTCFAVGTDGITLSTIDGVTWTRSNSPATQNLFGISCPSATMCVAVGAAGSAFLYGSGTWQALSTYTARSLNAIKCPSTSVCYAVGASGTILLTRTGGVIWSTMSSGTTANLLGIDCINVNLCVADGQAGTLIFTRDGATWAGSPNPTYNDLRTLSLLGSGEAWVAGAGGSVLHNPTFLTPPCASPNLAAAPVSPGATGGTVTFTASSTQCANPQYRFWMRGPTGPWTKVQDYSAGATFTWQPPATGVPGPYSFELDVRDASEVVSYDAVTSIPYQLNGCTAAGLTTSLPSPQMAGTTIVLNATAVCPGTPAFKFWVRAPGAVWSVVRDWDPSASFNWTTTGGPAGTYYLEADVRDQGSTAFYEATSPVITFQLGGSTCSAATLTAAPASPGATGGAVTFTAGATCANPRFKFWMAPPGGAWSVVQNYSASSTFNWNGAGVPGAYRFEVDVRDASSSASYDTVKNATYSLVGCTSATVRPSPAGGVHGATDVTFNATATCPGTATYRFWMRDPGSTRWSLVQDYSTNATYLWKAANQRAGTTLIEVDVRDQGSTAVYEFATSGQSDTLS